MRDFLYARCKEDKVLDVKATLVVRNQFWVAILNLMRSLKRCRIEPYCNGDRKPTPATKLWATSYIVQQS